MKFWAFCFGCLLSTAVWAGCPEGDFMRDKHGSEAARVYYDTCATYENDDETQLMLARSYQKGLNGYKTNSGKALLFYHLAADNGNAVAQVELAQLLLQLDETHNGRETVLAHNRKMEAVFKSNTVLFDGTLLHPYALLMLAAEKENQKWYYATTQKSAPAAAALLKNYRIDGDKKRSVIQQASRWKQRKMLEAAQDVMPESAYQRFREAVFPERGQADTFARNQAIERLREAIETYLKE